MTAADTGAAPAGPQALTSVLLAGGGSAGHVSPLLATADALTRRHPEVRVAALGTELNRRIVTAHQLAGVTVIDPATTWIDVSVTIGQDVTIEPGTQLRGRTTIGSDAVVGPDTTLTDVVVGEGARFTINA